MANDNINLYNFYTRYKWTAVDFTGWQEGMIDSVRGEFEGLTGAACLKGLDVVGSNIDLTVNVSNGIACAPEGELLVHSVGDPLVVPPSATFPAKHLVVLRTTLIDNTYIARPTSPYDPVPLKTQVTSTLILIPGTESATPVYPAFGVGDVVLAGVRIVPGQTTISDADLDLEVRDIPGKNSSFQQNFGKYDDRLRSFVYNNFTLGVYPSQSLHPGPHAFSYVNSQTPSIFPQSSVGVYEHDLTYLNFQTGEITGADGVSADFTPTIPSIGNSINATVGILYDDTIIVTYGTEGTFLECYNGILSRVSAGPGNILFESLTKPIAVITISSLDGLTVSDIKLTDLRGFTAVPDVNQIVLTANVNQNIDGTKSFVNNVECIAIAPQAPQHLTRKDYVDGYAPIYSTSLPDISDLSFTGLFFNPLDLSVYEGFFTAQKIVDGSILVSGEVLVQYNSTSNSGGTNNFGTWFFPFPYTPPGYNLPSVSESYLLKPLKTWFSYPIQTPKPSYMISSAYIKDSGLLRGYEISYSVAGVQTGDHRFAVYLGYDYILTPI